MKDGKLIVRPLSPFTPPPPPQLLEELIRFLPPNFNQAFVTLPLPQHLTNSSPNSGTSSFSSSLPSSMIIVANNYNKKICLMSKEDAKEFSKIINSNVKKVII